MNIEEKKAFLQNNAVPLMSTFAVDAKGNWGKMNVHQMIEHTCDFFNVSTGKIIFPLVTPEEHLPKYREFLVSDKEFRENTKAPVSVIGDEPLPIRTASLNDALSHLQKCINEFFGYFESDPGKTTVHPVFGPLNFEEWVLLHYKHVTHHLKQFKKADA